MNYEIIGELQNMFNFIVLHVLLQNKAKNRAIACCMVNLIQEIVINGGLVFRISTASTCLFPGYLPLCSVNGVPTSSSYSMIVRIKKVGLFHLKI